MKNTFHSLVNESGMEHFSDEKNGEIVVKYFTDLFRSTGTSDPSELLNGMDRSQRE